MRFTGRVLLASAFVLGACAGGEKAQDAANAATPTDTAASTATAGAVAAAPVTGTTHEVKMIMNDPSHASFEPANLTIHTGDAVKWTVVSGVPHNVVFDSVKASPDVKAQLTANMTDQLAPLSSKYLTAPGESYIMSFGKVPPGEYYYYCMPHNMLGMHGTITVE
jgi:plastocyanin